jgi:DHA1 family bicyclomycin/chloramphenicol resistance-like MFS transporter
MGSYGLSRAKYGIVFAMISLGLIASNRINMKFVHRLGVVGMLRAFTLIQTLGAVFVLVASIYHAPLWALLNPIVICFACAPGMGGNAMTLGMNPFPEKAGSAAAMIGLMQMVGAGIDFGDPGSHSPGCGGEDGLCSSHWSADRIRSSAQD